MKVLHFLKTGEYSGAENVAITIILKMKEMYGTEGIYVSPSGIVDNILEEKNIHHAVVNQASFLEYWKIVRKYEPDVIHAHDFSASVIAAFVKKDCKVISHLHCNPIWFRKINIKTLVYQFATTRFKSILGVSDSIFNEYVFAKIIDKKSMVIGNPFDVRSIVLLSENAKEGKKSDVLYMGRLAEAKNPKRFINVISEVLKEKEVHAFMVGDGELKEECTSLIKSSGLDNYIELVGFKENPYGYLKKTKVLCVPSIFEGFGLVVAEAFALGIPVVATPVGGMKKLVTEQAGYLSSDDIELANEITKLLNDKDYYNSKSSCAKQRAEELDNMHGYIKKMYEEIYN